MEVCAIDSMTDLTCEGHLKVVFTFFSFLKSKDNGVIVFDPSELVIDKTQFATEHWSATPYSPYKEDVPSNSPVPGSFVVSNHSGEPVVCLSRNVFIAFLNGAPIFVHSKK